MPEPIFDFDEARNVVALGININEGRQYFVNRVSFTSNTTRTMTSSGVKSSLRR
jgi:outer membrane protein assembly factor BamA